MLLVGLVGVGIVLSLRSPGVRRSVLEWAETRVLASTGWQVAVRDFELRPFALTVVLDGLEAGSPGELPVVRAEQVEVAPRLSTLLGGAVDFRRLVLAGAQVDLAQPFPPPLKEDEETDEGFALEVDELRVTGGRVGGAPVPDALRVWIADWWVEDVRVDGGVDEGGIDVRVAATPRWSRADGEEVTLSLNGQVTGPLGGPWQVVGLTLTGDGLEAALAATIGLEEEQPLAGTFELTLVPDRLLPVPAASGPVHAQGEVDGRALTGRLKLDAPGLPVELALPWLDLEPDVATRLAGGRLDLEADLTGSQSSRPQISGRTRLRAALDDRILVDAEIAAPEDAPAEQGLWLDLNAALLPQLEGRRQVTATVTAPDLARVAEGRIDDGQLTIAMADLSALLRELAALAPESLPADVVRLTRGALDLTGRFSGPWREVAGRAEVNWRPTPGALIEMTADGEPGFGGGVAKLAAHGVDLSLFDVTLGGTVGGTANLSWGSDGYRWQADLTGTQIEADPTWPAVDRLRLVGQGDARRVELRSLAATLGEREITAEGSAALGHPASGLAVSAAELRGSVTGLVAGLPRADLSLELEQGTVRGTVLPSLGFGDPGRIDLTVPLAALAELPALRGTIAGLPLAKARGPVTVDWDLPASDWQPLVAGLAGEPALRRLELGSRGRLTVDLRDPTAGVAEIAIDPLEIETQGGDVRGSGAVEIRVANGLLTLEAPDLRVEMTAPQPVVLTSPRVVATLDRERVLVTAATLGVDAGQVALTGESALAWPPRSGSIHLASTAIPWENDTAAVDLSWGDGRFRLEPSRLRLAGIEAVLEGEGPLAVLPPFAEPGAALSTSGPVTLRWQAAEADWLPLLASLGVEEPPELLRLASSGEIELDPVYPALSVGALRLDRLAAELGGRKIETDGPVELRLADGRLEIARLELMADGQTLTASGKIDLDRDWEPGQAAGGPVRRMDIQAKGAFAAAFLNPFLGGGAAEGILLLDGELSGTVEDLIGHLRLTGPDASLLFTAPYVARIDEPDIELEVADGVATVRHGRLRVNGGTVTLGGTLGGDGVALSASIEGLRARLDYGLLALIDGDLRLTLDPDPDRGGVLSGTLTVDQGSLTRPVAVDRDLITQLLVPIDLTGSEESAIESIALDLRVETRRGVRIHNNVADLSARWQPIAVRGNLLRPVLDGQVDIVPGGRVFLFGQTVRIDRGALIYSGREGDDGELELETTSSIEDPSIARLEGEDPLAPAVEAPSDLAAQSAALATGVATFYGERLTARVGAALGGTAITFRAIPVFGEADPGARLTVSRDFSRMVTLAASVDLRNAERRTYLLESHELPHLPSLRAQAFTTDTSSEGATLQQRLRFGGRRVPPASGPRIRNLLVEPPAGISKRGLRRALALAKGDPVSPTALFAAEVEVGEYLRRAGYPDARVAVTTEPIPERPARVDLRLTVNPGPRATFRFAGTPLSKTLRSSITALYRSDFYEPFALEEMQQQTVRALRSRGFLAPEAQVFVEVEPGRADGAMETRHVTIEALGGRRVDLEAIRVTGLTDTDADLVVASLLTTVQKVELAAGEPDADRRLLAVVRKLGYPRPEVAARELSADGKALTVAVEPGAPERIVSIEITGVSAPEAARLAPLTGLAPGDVAAGMRISAGVLAIERDLQHLGYSEAEARARLEPTADELRAQLTYSVDPGPRYEVAKVVFEGLDQTRPRWAEAVAGLPPGEGFGPDDLAAAERRLAETGLFGAIETRIEAADAGRADVLFEVEERTRYSVAYGARWDSDQGTSAVIDLAGDNFLGRNLSLGLRLLRATDDESARFNTVVPRLFGTRTQLDLFALVRNRIDAGFEEDILQTSAQLGYPLGRHLLGRLYARYSETHLVELDPFDPDFAIDTRINNPLLGLQLVYDSRDDELVMPEGWLATVDLSAADDFIGADQRFVRFLGQANWYRRLGRWGDRRIALAQSARIGLAESFDQELFRDNRFFAGGEYTVRGYAKESLGPQEDLGIFLRPSGGKALAVLNEELRFDLLGPVVGVAFFDLGNVWEKPGDLGLDLAKSVGIGFRAVTPIGLLRVDFALPLDRREGDRGSGIYFGFGSSF